MCKILTQNSAHRFSQLQLEQYMAIEPEITSRASELSPQNNNPNSSSTQNAHMTRGQKLFIFDLGWGWRRPPPRGPRRSGRTRARCVPAVNTALHCSASLHCTTGLHCTACAALYLPVDVLKAQLLALVQHAEAPHSIA